MTKDKRKNILIGLGLIGLGVGLVWWQRRGRFVEGPSREYLEALGQGDEEATVPGSSVPAQARTDDVAREVQAVLNDITQEYLPQAASVAYQVYVRGHSVWDLVGFTPRTATLVKMTELEEDGIIGSKTRDRYNWLKSFAQASHLSPLVLQSTGAPASLLQTLENLADQLQRGLRLILSGGSSQVITGDRSRVLQAGQNWLISTCGCQQQAGGLGCAQINPERV